MAPPRVKPPRWTPAMDAALRDGAMLRHPPLDGYRNLGAPWQFVADTVSAVSGRVVDDTMCRNRWARYIEQLDRDLAATSTYASLRRAVAERRLRPPIHEDTHDAEQSPARQRPDQAAGCGHL